MTQAITSTLAPIQALPLEVLQMHILAQNEILDFTDICALQKVCRLFHECAQQDFIWKPYLMRDYPLQECQENVQQVYRRAHLLRSNVIKGVFKKMRLGEQRITFSTTLSFANDKIISCGFGQLIKIWDLKTKECNTLSYDQEDLTLQSDIRAFATGDDRFLFFGLRLGKIKVYDLKIKEFILSFHVHDTPFVDNPLFSLAYSKGKLFVGMTDGTIKVLHWSAKKKELKEIKKLNALNPIVINLAVSGNTLVSIDGSGDVQFWDLMTYECRHKFNYPNIITFALVDKRFIIGSDNGVVDVLSIENAAVLHQMVAHPNRVESLVSIEGIFFSEDRSQRRIWNLATGLCIGALPRGLKHALQYAYSDGKLIYIDNYDEIGELNYLADDDEIFADIALLFRANLTEFKNALDRFNRMPKYAREQIYRKFAAFYPNSSIKPEKHFNDRTLSTPERRAEAIETYLAERRKEEVKK